MESQPITTNELKVTFDLDAALEWIASAINVEAPIAMHSTLHPSEVVKVARDCLVSAFRDLVDALGDADVQEHLQCYFIATSDLHKLIDKKLQPVNQDIH